MTKKEKVAQNTDFKIDKPKLGIEQELDGFWKVTEPLAKLGSWQKLYHFLENYDKEIYFDQITCEDFFQGLGNVINIEENTTFMSSIIAIMAFWHSESFVNLPSGINKIEQCFTQYLQIWE